MVLNRFSGWLDYPEYYFFWNLHGNNSIFNISAYKNPAMDRLIDRARFTDDPAEYDKSVKDFVALCMQEVPIIPLNQPIHDVAMQKAIGGYEFWFHREPDFRQFHEGLRRPVGGRAVRVRPFRIEKRVKTSCRIAAG